MESNEYEYAGFWLRTGATIIDSILILLVTTPMLLTIYGLVYYTDPTPVIIAGPADFLVSYVFPAIAVIVFWQRKQATPGKMLVAVKIVDATTGNPASTYQLIGRYFAYIISAIPLGLGYLWVVFDRRKQGWHDKLAGTMVIKKANTVPEPVNFEGV